VVHGISEGKIMWSRPEIVVSVCPFVREIRPARN